MVRRRGRAGALCLGAALAAGAAGCRDWKAGVDPARARAEPVQEALEGARPIESTARAGPTFAAATKKGLFGRLFGKK